jgi:hypothetical protein
VCPSVEQNEIDIYRVLTKDRKYTWKWTCSTHGLYVFWKENHPTLRGFFSTKLTFVQFYVNFITSSYSSKQFLDQSECILGFLMYQLFENGAMVRISKWTHWFLGARWRQKQYLLSTVFRFLLLPYGPQTRQLYTDSAGAREVVSAFTLLVDRHMPAGPVSEVFRM